jgi:hypothetical protein
MERRLDLGKPEGNLEIEVVPLEEPTPAPDLAPEPVEEPIPA